MPSQVYREEDDLSGLVDEDEYQLILMENPLL
jgi:hypothetical protein